MQLLAYMLLWFSCFSSFAWATRRHFRNTGAYTGGMRLTLGLGTFFALLQAGAIASGMRSPAALALYAASLALFWWTIAATRGKGFGACYASLSSLALVTTGPYRWVRHPFYCSYLLAWVAGAFLHPALVVAPLAMYVLYRRAAVDEEMQLADGPFGEEYRRYMRGTGRFFISFSSGKRARCRDSRAVL